MAIWSKGFLERRRTSAILENKRHMEDISPGTRRSGTGEITAHSGVVSQEPPGPALLLLRAAAERRTKIREQSAAAAKDNSFRDKINLSSA